MKSTNQKRVLMSDLLAKPEAPGSDTVLMAVRIPKALKGELDQVAKTIRKQKGEVVIALLNEGLVTYHGMVPAKAKPGRKARK